MPAASGCLICLAGIGSCPTPIVCCYAIKSFGPNMFFLLLMLLFLLICIYCLYRMSMRSTSEQVSASTQVALNTQITPIAIDIVQGEALKGK